MQRVEFHNYSSPIGKLIQQWLYKEVNFDQNTVELLMTADKQHSQRYFNELEGQGVDFLILDRYTTSQVVFSEASGISIDWTFHLQEYMRLPDYEIFIDIPPEVSMSRKGKHGENDRYESDKTLLKNVRDNYIKYYSTMDNVLFVEGESTIEEIHEEIWEWVERILEGDKIK